MNMKRAFKSEEGKKAVLDFYDSLLERWPLPHERFNLSTRYGSTFIVAAGDAAAPPLVLLHGSGSNSAMWLNDAITYSKNFRVYLIDMPGEPGRSDECQLPFDTSAYADWLLDVLNALMIEKASIVGISLGAWLAVKFSVSHTERVEKLVLLCPSGIGPQKLFFIITAMICMLQGEKGMEKLSYKVNGNQPIHEIVMAYQKLIAKGFNFRREPIPLFNDAELQRLDMPIILFAGGKDIILDSAKTVARVRRLLPMAEVNYMPEAGHTLINLTPEIAAFLGK